MIITESKWIDSNPDAATATDPEIHRKCDIYDAKLQRGESESWRYGKWFSCICMQRKFELKRVLPACTVYSYASMCREKYQKIHEYFLSSNRIESNGILLGAVLLHLILFRFSFRVFRCVIHFFSFSHSPFALLLTFFDIIFIFYQFLVAYYFACSLFDWILLNLETRRRVK